MAQKGLLADDDDDTRDYRHSLQQHVSDYKFILEAVPEFK
jgi:hypothetical protein